MGSTDGFVVWFTGLSGSGKSTLASMLAAELSQRGVHAKGLYARALAGEIKGFTGVDDPYEPPSSPEVVVHTDREAPHDSLAKIVAKLESLGYLPRASRAYRAAEPRKKGVVPPHGGELVDRFVRGDARQRLVDRAAGLRRVKLDDRGASDLELIGNGAYSSPLKGFMTPRDYLRVVRERRLENGLVWSVPITLAVSREEAEPLVPGTEVALESPDGRLVAVMELSDRWVPDKELEAREVYRTNEASHPGVAYLKSSGQVYLGGEVWLVERPLAPRFPAYPRDPAATRALFEARGWRRVVGFQTRNPMHRAHEYITKCALEITDGLLLHPLVGETKSGDIPADVRMRCYEVLLEKYYPAERVVLGLYPAAMRYAGPREAIFHALVRKNYGCSHFIVGRDHAGVGQYYGVYDAQRAFEDFSAGELGIEPLAFDDAFWSTVVGGMATDKTAPGDASTRVSLSGTQVRELLRAGKLPPPELTRPEVGQLLLDEARRR